MLQFEQYQEFLKGFERSRLAWASQFQVSQQLAQATAGFQQAILAQSAGMNAILKQMKLTLPEMNLIKHIAPSLPDLKLFQANHLLAERFYESFSGILSVRSRLAESIGQQQASWRRAIADSLSFRISEHVQQAFLAQQAGLKDLLRSFGERTALLHQQNLFALCLEPQRVYAEFVQRTIARIGEVSVGPLAGVLKASLNLTSTQLLQADNLLAKAFDAVDEEDATEVIPLSASLVIPRMQQEELVESGITDSDAPSILPQHSEAAALNELARQILMLVHDCNEAGQIVLKQVIFKPTNRSLYVFSQLPWMLPVDRGSFADAVDCLFWLLYEGAGDDGLRFLGPEKGLLTKDEAKPVFDVKFLRNKWLRHDPDHGTEPKIRQGWENVSAVLTRLGISHLPTTEGHFRLLYRRMLEAVKGFLERVLDRLNRIGPEKK